MAKWCGVIGFTEHREVAPGIWDDSCVEKTYYGDMLNISQSIQTSSDVMEGIRLNNKISIAADFYAISNSHKMKYIRVYGTNWLISDANIQYPRIIITTGGIYNGGQQAEATNTSRNSTW